MQSPGREPSMEDILASIKKVIAEEKELRVSGEPIDSVEDEPLPEDSVADDDVLELDQIAQPKDLGPPLVDEELAGQSRQKLEACRPLRPLSRLRRLPTRSRISSARCCGRCSSNGSMTICRRWSTSM